MTSIGRLVSPSMAPGELRLEQGILTGNVTETRPTIIHRWIEDNIEYRATVASFSDRQAQAASIIGEQEYLFQDGSSPAVSAIHMEARPCHKLLQDCRLPYGTMQSVNLRIGCAPRHNLGLIEQADPLRQAGRMHLRMMALVASPRGLRFLENSNMELEFLSSFAC